MRHESVCLIEAGISAVSSEVVSIHDYALVESRTLWPGRAGVVDRVPPGVVGAELKANSPDHPALGLELQSVVTGVGQILAREKQSIVGDEALGWPAGITPAAE